MTWFSKASGTEPAEGGSPQVLTVAVCEALKKMYVLLYVLPLGNILPAKVIGGMYSLPRLINDT